MFKNKLKGRLVTKEEIWSVITLSYLKVAEEATKGYLNTDDIRSKLAMMKKSGLQFTSNYQVLSDKYKLITANSNLAEFIVETKETYPDSVILPWSELLSLCNKYDLECAPLNGKYYDKLIPNENIEEMMSVRISKEYADKYKVNEFNHISKIDLVIDDDTTSESEMSKIVNVMSRFPFSIRNNNMTVVSQVNSTLEFHGCKPVYNITDSLSWDQNMTSDDWIICAPSKDIKEQSFITIDTKSRYEAEQARIRVQDPLVGKFCRYGFIIFSKWGREATLDEVLKWSKL